MSAPRTAPTLLGSAARILDLSLGQMLWSRRSVFLGLLLGGPVLLAVALRVVDTLYRSGFQINGAPAGGAAVLGMMGLPALIPLLVPVLRGVFWASPNAHQIRD